MKKKENKVYIETYDEGITHIYLEKDPKEVAHNCLFKFEENGTIFTIGLDKNFKISEIEIDSSILPDSFIN